MTLLMHLAAAVEVPGEMENGIWKMPKNRPCVVVAGGREPAQWEAYPHHQYLHTNGALRCCDNGGCWKSRVVPLGDGDAKDEAENLCVDVVHQWDPALSFTRTATGPGPAHAAVDAPWRELTDFLPHCMDMISEEDVIRRIELYFDGGAVDYLTAEQSDATERTVFSEGSHTRISP